MKIILWDTNFNGKLDCNRFVHIDLAPVKAPTMDELGKAVFQIQTADKSHEPVTAGIEAIIPFRIGELSNIHTWPSHGMNTSDFLNWQHSKKKINDDTMLAVYYYKAIQ